MSIETINGIEYLIGKFPGGAREAFKVFRRVHLRGTIEAVERGAEITLDSQNGAAVNGAVPANGKEIVPIGDQAQRLANPILLALANMSDADFQIVIDACLRTVSWKDPATGVVSRLIGPSGALMFAGADDVLVQMQLAQLAMDENFTSFSPAPTP